MPLPRRSIARANKTYAQLVEIYKKNLPRVELAYPNIAKGFLAFILSEKYPENTLRRLAKLSAIPSIKPSIAGLAPKVVTKKTGNIG
jgi:hypothetical protein